MKRRILAGLALPFVLAACGDDDPIGPEGTVPVRIAFSTTASAGTQRFVASRLSELMVTGDNGTLLITDIRLIVSEFELEGAEDACLAAGNDDDDLDDCEEFEAPPSLLAVPLDGSEVVVATEEVPEGTYSELEFEVEDLEEDEDDLPLTRERIQQIRTELETLFPGIPPEASMVVTGTFTPTGGAAQSFTVFFDADIEVEMDLVPPVVIDAAGAASRTITVNLEPMRWFMVGADVLDLSAFDGQTLEFEAELEDGFEVELDDDLDDDDD